MAVLQSWSGSFTRAVRNHALETRTRLRWLLTERTSEAVLYRGFAILFLVTLVTAYFSETFFFPDEHYQVLEFMSYKLGITSAADLPWEFRAQVRPWMQPFLYSLIAKPLMFAGVRDLFNVTFVLRLATACVSLAALAAFAKLLFGDLVRPDEKFAYARMLPFMGFLPYLFVRTASETISAAFFTLGLVLAVQAARSGSLRRIAAAGILCGLAFECRYQSAFLILGLLLWMAFQARARMSQLLTFAAAGIVPVAAALPIDRWGYGVWCFPPWNYLNVNVFQGVAAEKFGSAPFFAYLYLVPGNIFFPIAVVIIVTLIVACLRNPRHYVTWVTAPFFVVHCLLAHKEERFLFPLAILATSYPVLAFSPSSDRLLGIFGRLWPYRRSILSKAVAWSAVAAMVFLAVHPFGIRPHMMMAKYVYRHFAGGLTAYTFDEEAFKTYPMYRPPNYRSDTLQSRAELESLLAKGPVYLFSETPALSAQVLPEGVQASLLYSEFPFAADPGLASWSTQLVCDFADLQRTTPLRPPRLAWMTLFRLQRGGSATPGTVISPCTPDWSRPRK